MNPIPIGPAVLDLPPAGDYLERRAIWQRVDHPDYDASLVVIERGPGRGPRHAGRKERVRTYRAQFDAAAGTWLLLPLQSDDGELYELTPYSCSCKAAKCRKSCTHRQAFAALYAEGLI